MSQSDLIDYMKMCQRVMHKQISQHADHGVVYCGAEDFLLKCGRWYAPQPLPKQVRQMKIKQCYNNAYDLASRCRRKYRYVEGIAHAIIPIAHAWCTDKHGNVIDPTLREIATAYCGVEFPIDEVTASLCDGATMLDNYQQGHPLFRRVWEPRFNPEWGESLNLPEAGIESLTSVSI